MSLSRMYHFFQDSFNHTLAVAGANIELNTYIEHLNQTCQIMLTTTNQTCDSFNAIVWGGIKGCTHDSSWLKELSLATCDELSSFSEQLLDCIEQESKSYLNSIEETCPLSHADKIIGIVSGALVLAVIAGAAIGLGIYLKRNSDSENQPAHARYGSI